MRDITLHVANFPVVVFVGIAAAVLFLEAGALAGLVLPGAGTAMAMGSLVSPEAGTVRLALVCLTAVAATTTGAHFGYLRGRSRGEQPAERGLHWPAQRWLDRALAQIERHAIWVVPAAHCVAYLRTLIPRAAGRAGISYRKFAFCVAPGAFLWGTALVLLGHTARVQVGNSIHLSPWLLGVLLLAALLRASRLRSKRPGTP